MNGAQMIFYSIRGPAVFASENAEVRGTWRGTILLTFRRFKFGKASSQRRRTRRSPMAAPLAVGLAIGS